MVMLIYVIWGKKKRSPQKISKCPKNYIDLNWEKQIFNRRYHIIINY